MATKKTKQSVRVETKITHYVIPFNKLERVIKHAFIGGFFSVIALIAAVEQFQSGNIGGGILFFVIFLFTYFI